MKIICINNDFSTQSVDISKLISEYGFSVVCPPDKEIESIIQILIGYQRKLAKYVNLQNVRTIQDFQ